MTLCLKVCLHRATSSAERSASFRTRTNSWTRLRAVERFGSTNNRTGLSKDILMSSSTESVMVAEKSMVWRDLGHDLMISVNSSWKPSESIRSASSNTRISIASSVNPGELRIWSMRRPGVAKTISGRVRSAASCDFRERPPVFHRQC